MSDLVGRPPVLYLDVDGPVAPSGGEPSYPGPVRWADLPMGRYHFPADSLERLVDLHERELVRVEWLTSWQDHAATILAPALGLPEWPAHTRSDAPKWYECPLDTNWWKERVVLAAVEAGERVIWVDDDIDFRIHDLTLANYAERLLTVCPDGATGLTGADLDAIEVWVTGQR